MAYPTNIINDSNTDLSTFTVKIDGMALDPTYAIAGITVHNCINKIPTAQLVIFDGDAATQDFEASSSDLFVPGNKVEISLGYHNDNFPVFEGIIIKHGIKMRQGRPSLLIVDLKDTAVKLTVGRKNKCFYKKTDKAIIKEIIGEYSDVSFGAALGVPSGPEVTHEEMVQYYATDWDFILSRADANGYLVFVENGEITVGEPSTVAMPKLNLTQGINVYEFEASMDARNEYSEVKAQSWNDAQRKIAEKSSSSATFTEEGDISGKELSDVIGLDNYTMQHPGNISDQEIDAWAKAKLLRSRLSKITGRVKIEGYGKIKPGDLINVNKFSTRFNNIAFVSDVTHSVSGENAWYTDIQFGYSQEWFTSKYKDVTDEPAAGLLPAVNGLMIGIIKDIEQVDTDFRVKVHIPMVNEGNDGIWARFAAPYAGEKRGMLFRPEIEDEVVIGFLNDDPREPVVLGSLQSANDKGKPPVEIEKENNIKGIYTRSGIKIEIDDDKQTVLIETPEKNKIWIDDKESPSMLLEDMNKNKIEMSDEGIVIETEKSFTIKAGKEIIMEAPSISQTADQEIVVDSGGTLDLTCSLNLKIEGQLVNIN